MEIEKLSTTLRTKSSVPGNETQGQGGSHIPRFGFQTSGWLHGLTGGGNRLTKKKE